MFAEEIIIDLIRTYFISICTYYMNLKIINRNVKVQLKEIIIVLFEIIFITAISEFLKVKFSFPYMIIWIGLLISSIFSINTKNSFAYSMLVTIVSLSINYVIFIVGIILNFLLNIVINVKSEYINLCIIIIMYLILFSVFLKVKRLKQGLAFLQRRLENEYFDTLILNVSISIICTVIALSNYDIL